MKKDEVHHENVVIMVEACRAMKVAFSEVSVVINHEWINDAARKMLEVSEDAGPNLVDLADKTRIDYIGEIQFAAGYLQATSNLTGVSWADQLAEVAAAEDGPAASPDHLVTDVRSHLEGTDALIARVNKELEPYKFSQIDDAIAYTKGRELQCISTGALFEAYIYQRANYHLQLNKEQV